jgi:thymidylate synthase (FAD)
VQPNGDRKICVLDHGFVRLVDSMGSDLSIVRAARVSFDAAWRAGEDEGSDARLIRYLWKNKHSTPFEAVELQFDVMAPIFVFRQWHRHRTWSFSELSGRYRELPELFYLPDPETVGEQAVANKQGRQAGGDLEARRAEVKVLRAACESAFSAYHQLLIAGWPRELARCALPLNAYSHMFAKVDLRNLFGFLDLRADSHAQYEIRVYAEAMLELVRPIAPVAVSAWEASRADR